VALGEKFSHLDLTAMKKVVQQTKFYSTPNEALDLLTGQEIKSLTEKGQRLLRKTGNRPVRAKGRVRRESRGCGRKPPFRSELYQTRAGKEVICCPWATGALVIVWSLVLGHWSFAAKCIDSWLRLDHLFSSHPHDPSPYQAFDSDHPWCHLTADVPWQLHLDVASAAPKESG
jgi:hypothetical protein